MFLMLLLGVLLYVFYIFQDAPVLFIPDKQAQTTVIEQEFNKTHRQRKLAAQAYLKNPQNQAVKQQFIQADQQLQRLRKNEMIRQQERSGKRRNDTNYILPYFVLTQMSTGLIGLIVATILAAALSSIDSGLNSLASSTVIDWYQRLSPTEKSDRFLLNASRMATAGWGVFAVLAALAYGETDSIVELVNKVGSYFYGAILGVFALIWIKPANGWGALVGLIFGMFTVFLFDNLYLHPATQTYHFFASSPAYHKVLSYLWLNPIGTFSVIFWGIFIGLLSRNKSINSLK